MTTRNPPNDNAYSDLSDEYLRAAAAMSEPPSKTERFYQVLAAGFFIATIIFFLCMVSYWLLIPRPQGDLTTNALLYYHLPPIAMLLAGIICIIFGYLLLNILGAATRNVLPRQDQILLNRLLLDEKEKGVGLYILLNSLSGVTGVFTKIGFSGLPLATMGLTIFLVILSSYNDRFSQMAQLTLGAFLGSFVERRQSGAVSPSAQISPGPGAGIGQERRAP